MADADLQAVARAYRRARIAGHTHDSAHAAVERALRSRHPEVSADRIALALSRPIHDAAQR